MKAGFKPAFLKCGGYMKKILTSEQMKICDRNTIEAGTPSSVLMERAAQKIADIAMTKCIGAEKVLVVCGNGNNGSDGVLTALFLADNEYDCSIMFAGDREHLSHETAKNIKKAEEKGILFVDTPDFNSYSLIIDAIFGIGLSRPVEGRIAEIINRINASNAEVLSVDIPSGLSADTGRIMGVAVVADYTVAIEAVKRGHLVGDGVNCTGRLFVESIGIDTDIAGDSGLKVMTDEELRLIPRRKRNSNKGNYGRVLVIAGSVGMSGAAYLSAAAAYRCGAGLVEIYTPEENREILQTLLPEAIVTAYDKDFPDMITFRAALSRATAVVIGPGLGKSKTSEQIVRETYKCADAPLIVDADALNITAEKKIEFPTDVPIIITPHPGEMSRLTGADIKEMSADPVSFARIYAEENEVICVLKFARTVITDGNETFVNITGNPSMAKGGSGDVLTGVIAGMLCCDLSPIHSAALGAYIHGSAGDISEEYTHEAFPIARDIIDNLAPALKDGNR